MRKQFTYFMAVLALSTALIGCGSKEAAAPSPAADIETSADTQSPAETPSAEDTTAEDTAAPDETQQQPEENTAAEQKDENAAAKEETAKTEEADTDKPAASAKPQTGSTANASSTANANKPAASAKPQTGSTANTAKPTASAKPQTGSTAKPAASAKPQTNTTANTTKPETAPETKPEASAKPEAASLTASQVFDKVVAGVELPMTMEMDSAMLSDMYGIDASILKSYKVIAPVMSAHITEIAVFEVNDASGIDAVKAGIEKRAGGINPQYLYPSLQEAYENRQTIVSGNYIFFAMDENVDKLAANFNSAVK